MFIKENMFRTRCSIWSSVRIGQKLGCLKMLYHLINQLTAWKFIQNFSTLLHRNAINCENKLIFFMTVKFYFYVSYTKKYDYLILLRWCGKHNFFLISKHIMTLLINDRIFKITFLSPFLLYHSSFLPLFCLHGQ